METDLGILEKDMGKQTDTKSPTKTDEETIYSSVEHYSRSTKGERLHNKPSRLSIKSQDGKSVTVLEPHERQVVECWSRVMGYHRPVSGWNKGKVSEWKERKFFSVKS